MAKNATPAKDKPLNLRDRIQEFRRVDVAELADNGKNWRVHPAAQVDALRGVLAEIGIAGALTGYHSERNGGALTLIDGHARKQVTAEGGVWPVLILDVTDAEADLLLATLDPLSAMAEADATALDALLRGVSTESEAVTAMLAALAEENGLYQDSAPEERESPDDFKEVGEDIETEHTCPKCGYAWSGGY